MAVVAQKSLQAEEIHIRRSSEISWILSSLTPLISIASILWIFFWLLSSQLPYIKQGSDVVYAAKIARIHSATLLDRSKEIRVFVFGNSKVLSGFIPALFESLVPQSSAYNLGLPNATHFVPELETLVVRGEIPTHVLITVPWEDPARKPATFFRPIPDDVAAMNRFFPFRTFFSDLFIFLQRSRTFGGPPAFYEDARQAVAKMDQDRGYYFIAGQSVYPGDQLPPGLRLDSDSQARVFARDLDDRLQAFETLRTMAERHRFKIVLIPSYYRMTEAGPPQTNVTAGRLTTRHPNVFEVAGPEYFQYPNSSFSDLNHLNRDGARVYTERIADLVKTQASK